MPIKAPTEDGTAIKTVTKKLYYLACAFCRWTSRDAGLQDQVTVLGNYTIHVLLCYQRNFRGVHIELIYKRYV